MASIIKANELQDFGGNSILTSDGSGNVTLSSGMNTAVAAGTNNTPAFKAYISTGQSIPDSTNTKVTFQTEMYDTDNCYDNTTNYRFTPTEAGKYFFTVRIRFESSSTSNAQYWIAKNGDTSVNTLPTVIYGNDFDMAYHVEFLSGALELNGSSDYVEVYVYQPSGGAVNISASFTSSFEGYKIIGA